MSAESTGLRAFVTIISGKWGQGLALASSVFWKSGAEELNPLGPRRIIDAGIFNCSSMFAWSCWAVMVTGFGGVSGLAGSSALAREPVRKANITRSAHPVDKRMLRENIR